MKDPQTSRKLEKIGNSYVETHTTVQQFSLAEIIGMKSNIETELAMISLQRKALDDRETELKDKLNQIVLLINQ